MDQLIKLGGPLTLQFVSPSGWIMVPRIEMVENNPTQLSSIAETLLTEQSPSSEMRKGIESALRFLAPSSITELATLIKVSSVDEQIFFGVISLTISELQKSDDERMQIQALASRAAKSDPSDIGNRDWKIVTVGSRQAVFINRWSLEQSTPQEVNEYWVPYPEHERLILISGVTSSFDHLDIVTSDLYKIAVSCEILNQFD